MRIHKPRVLGAERVLVEHLEKKGIPAVMMEDGAAVVVDTKIQCVQIDAQIASSVLSNIRDGTIEDGESMIGECVRGFFEKIDRGGAAMRRKMERDEKRRRIKERMRAKTETMSEIDSVLKRRALPPQREEERSDEEREASLAMSGRN